MNINVEFLICCIEEFKVRHNISGRKAYDMLLLHGIDDYILQHYDALHTAGVEYTIQEVEQMMN